MQFTHLPLRVALLGSLIVLASPPARSADEDLLAAARKEGEVVWYTSLIVDQMVRPMEAAFTKKYPGIKFKYERSNTEDIILKVINEAKANRVQVDVVDGSNVSTTLVKEGGLVPDWLPEEAKIFPAHLKDPTASHWIATNLYIMEPAYNTSLVKPGTQPKTTEDLLDPKWAGKMTWSGNVSGASGTGFVGNILASKGETAGREYLRKLAKQNIVAHNTSSRQVLDQVIAGEFSIIIQAFHHQASISAAKGAPIDWIPMSPATVNLAIASLVKNSPHPNAGKLLLSYMVSDEGQTLYAKSGYIPAKPNIPAADPKLKPEIGGFEALYFNPDEFDNNLPKWYEIFQEIFK